jgi:uncharacterized protein (TIGR03083 family)
MKHDEIIDRIDTSWSGFSELIDSIPPERALEPLSAESWSVRDIVGHIAYWERFAAERIANPAERQPVIFDQINEAEYARISGLTYDQALAELRESHQLLTGAVRDHPEVTPDDVACDSWEHYEEHGNDIRTWLNGR